MFAKKRRIQQLQQLQQQQAPPETIFRSLTNLEEDRMRMVFFDQLEEMVEKCTFPCPPGMSPFLKNPAKQRIRIPHDLDPQKFIHQMFFVDYMNIFPSFQRALLAKEKWRTDPEVWKDTSFQDKIDSLYLKPYRIALVDYVFSLKNLATPQPQDWVFIVCQGRQKCGKLFYESSPFLHHCHLLIIEVPCVDNLNYYPLFTSRDCHVLFEKNEVDDYFLLYCLLYFQSYRDRLQRTTPFHPLLGSQKLVLISNDQYSWGTEKKQRVQKLPSPWPSHFAFTMGKAPPSLPKTRKAKGLKKK